MKTSNTLSVGSVYTRKQLKEMFGITDATINTGVFHPKDHDSIWLFVTEQKTPDRTQYADMLEDEILQWDGQISGRTDSTIITHASDDVELLVFYRREKYEYPNAAFRYEGAFEYIDHSGSRPAHFILRRADKLEQQSMEDIESIRFEEDEFFEGAMLQRFTNYFERNPKLRAAAIRIHGTVCKVCGFDFYAAYGERGQGYIEVHHIKPISSGEGAAKISPKTDMTVLCSNCHRMIHRRFDDVLTVEQLKELMFNVVG